MAASSAPSTVTTHSVSGRSRMDPDPPLAVAPPVAFPLPPADAPPLAGLAPPELMTVPPVPEDEPPLALKPPAAVRPAPPVATAPSSAAGGPEQARAHGSAAPRAQSTMPWTARRDETAKARGEPRVAESSKGMERD